MWTELDKSVRIYRSRQVCENVWRPGGLRLQIWLFAIYTNIVKTNKFAVIKQIISDEIPNQVNRFEPVEDQKVIRFITGIL